MSAFGDQLRSIIEIFQLKYINVANVMQYDASYISKWINSDVLPSTRAIRQICNNLADYVVSNCNDDQISVFCDAKGFDFFADKQELKEAIIKLLNNSFQADTAERKAAESEKQIISEDRTKTVKMSLKSLRERSDSLNMIILGDIATLREEDLLFLMDIFSEIKINDFKDGEINIMISKTSIINAEAARPLVTLMNLLMLQKSIKTTVSSVPAHQTGLIILFENLLYTAQCRMDSGWLTESFSKDVDYIKSKMHILKEDMLPISRSIYTEHEILPLSTSGGISIAYWMHRERQLLGKMDTSYCIPELQDRLFSNNPEIAFSCQKQYKNLIRLLDSGAEHKCVIYRDAMEELVYMGIISVAGKDIKLSVSERLLYLQGIILLMDKYPNLKIRMIDGYVVDEIKHRTTPSLYLSNSSCGFLMFPVEGVSTYCLIQSNRFSKMMNRMFDNIWDQKGVIHHDIREYMYMYIQFCQDIVLLDEL